MDAISSLVAGSQRAAAVVDGAAEQIAAADLPTGPPPDVMASAPPSNHVDVAEQMTVLAVAGGQHAVTTAALRAALSMYQTSLEMLTNPHARA